MELLHGTIEDVPLPDASIDVVISNCVIVLSGDKDATFAEIARVLRPGGRVGISDIVRAELDDGTPTSVTCGDSAITVDAYEDSLRRAGLAMVTIELTDPARKLLAEKGYDPAFGARPLARVIEETVKRPLTDELLFGALENGGTATVDAREGEIVLRYPRINGANALESADHPD